jgi:tetratricopeptide (TPR) repeat protein
VTPTPRFAAACVVVVWLSALLSAPALAQQTGRLAGSVKDMGGRPIKGAAVRARNAGGIPSEFNVSSDARGNWGMLGLVGGLWEVTASAPGFESSTLPVRVSVLRSNPELQFVLVGTPVKGALDGIDSKALQNDLSTAEASMAAGQYDDALTVYRTLLSKAPALTSLNLAIGRALRLKKDYAAAEEAYGAFLKAEPSSQKALLELGRTQQEKGDRAGAIATLERAVALDPATDEAKDARALLAQLKQSS